MDDEVATTAREADWGRARYNAASPTGGIMARVPDDIGYFGGYGGSWVPETLMHPLEELEIGRAHV